MAHEKRRKLGINLLRRPVWRDGNDAGIVLDADLGTEVPLILREYDTTLCNGNVVYRRVFCASVVEVVLNMLEIKVLVESRVPLSWL